MVGFSGSSADKGSACNAGDPGSIPGWGRCPGEGIGYPLQYSWASLVAQMVKNPPAVWETWVRSLGWENPLEESMATHSSILENSGEFWRILENPMDRAVWRATVHSVAKSQTWLKWLRTQCIPQNNKVHLTAILNNYGAYSCRQFPTKNRIFFLLQCHRACGILVHRLGIELVLPAVDARSLSHWTTREISKIWFSNSIFWNHKTLPIHVAFLLDNIMEIYQN